MSAGRVAAVTGATGRQGSAVVRHLLARGWVVRALTRKPQGATAVMLQSLGAHPWQADLEDRSSLEAAFDGADAVYSVQNPMTSGLVAEVRQGRNVAEAAKTMGVSHLVYGGAGTGDKDTGIGSWNSKLEVEQHLRDLEVPHTVLRPMAFMELMTDRAYYPALSTWHVMPRLMGEDRPVAWICVDDLGAVAAQVFAEPDRFVGTALSLCSDVRSLRECRAIWRRQTGRAPRGLPIPVWLFERLAGTDLTTMWRWLRTADIEMSTEETRRLLPPARTVEEWVAERT